MRKKSVYVLLLLVVLAFSLFMALGFRLFLYKQLGQSSVIAGSLPNFVAVLLLALLYMLVKGNRPDSTPLKLTVMASGTMIFYELVQPLIPGRVFDFSDIIASIIGGLFTYAVFSTIEYLAPKHLRPHQKKS